MSYAVCTLFEKHYHYGVGALTNSLYKKGFRGSIYAGYRGALPPWSSHAKDNPSLQWEGAKTLDVAQGLQIHFLPLKTDFYFSNYKPDFMLSLFEGPAKDDEGIAYIDPDIVIKCKWDFFETWMSYGVALVHDVGTNDMASTHPVRKGWEQLIKDSNRNITTNIFSYINAGFCGVSKANKGFLKIWIEFIDVAIKKYGFNSGKPRGFPIGHIFFNGDQDALNITAMCSGYPISEIGPEGMDFLPGGLLMSHAVWKIKPWNKHFISWAFKGRPTTKPEYEFWKNVRSPIQLYSPSKMWVKFQCLKISSFIGRFYRRY